MFDHFDIIAPFYDRVIHKLDLNRLTDLLKLPTRGRMLDAGGGTGRVSSRLRSLIDEIVVCDLSLSMLKQAKNKGRLLTVQTYAEKLPFPNESFDFVLCWGEMTEAVKELIRVIKKGGKLSIFLTNRFREAIDLFPKDPKAAIALAELHSDYINHG